MLLHALDSGALSAKYLDAANASFLLPIIMLPLREVTRVSQIVLDQGFAHDVGAVSGFADLPSEEWCYQRQDHNEASYD